MSVPVQNEPIEVRAHGQCWIPARVIRADAEGLDAEDEEGGIWSMDTSMEGRNWRKRVIA